MAEPHPSFGLCAARMCCSLALSLALTQAVHAQNRYDEALLAVKRMFGDTELAALAEPYTGIRTSGGIAAGLFPIKATGVSTDPIRFAADKFLATLTQPQLLRTLFAAEDAEWRKWSNVDNGIYVRQGVSLEEMSALQRDAAFGLMRASLSAKGVQQSLDIMKTDQTLRELNDDTLRYGEQKYFFTLMGQPSPTEPWGWQLDGHHLVVNFFVLGDQVVMTPVFMGGEPVVTDSGRYAGNAILQAEQNQGLALLRSLSAEQRRSAVLPFDKTRNFLEPQAGRDNLVLDPAGIRASSLTAEQKLRLFAIIELYVGNLREEHARVRLDEIQLHLDDTYFAWVGRDDDDAVFYYRIQSPVILIEFDHQQPVGNPSLPRNVPTRQHIHTMVRTPNGNDYGKNLLRQHLERHPHGGPAF